MPTTSTCRPGRPRSEASRQKILDAALAALDASGIVGLTVDGIAARAGVSKATIYRWWPNKAAVVMEAFLGAMDPQLACDNTGSVREDVRLQMLRLVDVLCGPRGQKLLALLAHSRTDQDIATA